MKGKTSPEVVPAYRARNSPEHCEWARKIGRNQLESYLDHRIGNQLGHRNRSGNQEEENTSCKVAVLIININMKHKISIRTVYVLIERPFNH